MRPRFREGLGIAVSTLGAGFALLNWTSKPVGIGFVLAGIGMLLWGLSDERRPSTKSSDVAASRPDAETSVRPVVAVTLAVSNLQKLASGELPFKVANIGSAAARFVRLKIHNVGGATVDCDEVTLLAPGEPPVQITGRIYEHGHDMTSIAAGLDANWFRAKMRQVTKGVNREIRFPVTVEYANPDGKQQTERVILRCSPSLDVRITRD